VHLHLVALGDSCGYGVLVTLGACRHLDDSGSVDGRSVLFLTINVTCKRT